MLLFAFEPGHHTPIDLKRQFYVANEINPGIGSEFYFYIAEWAFSILLAACAECHGATRPRSPLVREKHG